MTQDAAPDGPKIIAPVDFRGKTRAVRRKSPLGRRVGLGLLALLVVALGVAGWFVLTARQVGIIIEPTPETVTLDGPPLRFRLDDRYLLWPGEYTVRATLEGYHDLEETFFVGADGADEVRLFMSPLPGLVTMTGAPPLDGIEAYVDDVRIGALPIDDHALEIGTYALRFELERYQTHETELTVEGYGKAQDVTVTLRPDWADVTISAEPEGAEVWVDGRQIDIAPCTLELLSGRHVVEVKAERFQDWRRELTIVAEEPVSITGIVLDPAPGIVIVRSDPAGAQVLVDGVYSGTTPVEAETPPDRDVIVRVSADGYTPDQQMVNVAPTEREELSFELRPQMGTVYLEIDPPDATLHVDGAPWGETPGEVSLLAVEHRLEFSRDGYVSASHTVRPRPGIPDRVVVRLEPIPEVEIETQKEWKAANGYTLVAIEPATVTLGASRREQGRRSNETLRTVRLERPFLMGTHEVTNQEYRAFRPGHQSGTFERVLLSGRDDPVVQVTWDDAARFCNWLSRRDDLPVAYMEVGDEMHPVDPMTTGYRLPTEAEWAMAARLNGSDPLLKYPWGDGFPPRKTKSGNYADESAANILNRRIENYEDGFEGPAPVGSFAANRYDLFDLGGNVSEWCHDYYSIYTYDEEEVGLDPMGPEEGVHHVVRGSSWRHSSITTLRFSYREYSDDKRDDLGFRICRYITEASE